MSYNPKHCTILVVNEDGSGFLRQYKTLSEAKEAYKLISAEGGKAVYLYPPATKSISYKAAGTPPPISNTDSEVNEDGVTRKPVSFTSEQNITFGASVATPSDVDGMIMSCEQATFLDYVGNQFTSLSKPVGFFGSYEQNGVVKQLRASYPIGTKGCNLPNGYKSRRYGSFIVGLSEEFKIDSIDNGLYGEYYYVRIQYHMKIPVNISDGQGGVVSGFHYGCDIPFDEYEENISKLEQDGSVNYRITVYPKYQEGQIPYKLVFKPNGFIESQKSGSPIQNGNYLVSYWKNPANASEGIASGYWSFRMVHTPELGEQKEYSPRIKFIPIEPEDPPPPQNSVRKAITNDAGVVIDEVFDEFFVKNPYRIQEDMYPIEVQIEGSDVVVGTHSKIGIDDGWGTEYWGPFRDFYITSGVKIHETENWNYYSDGIGGWVTTPKGGGECATAGTILSSSSETVYVSILGEPYEIGESITTATADGICGENTDVSTTYLPSGELITIINEENYRSNGIGGYNIYPIEGQLIGGSEISVYVVITEEGDYSAVVGSFQRTSYTDGFGGSYNEDGAITYVPYGTEIYSSGSGGSDYFSDGLGGYYAVSVPCDEAGTVIQTIPNGAVDIYITEISEMAPVGQSYTRTYADGFCGTYTSTYTDWYAYGWSIAVGGGYEYFSNGEGGYYAEPVVPPPCDPEGTTISSNTTDRYIYINELALDVVAGSDYENTYADGNCGSYTDSGGSWYSYGSQIGSDESYYYLSDENGGYYLEVIDTPLEPCDESGAVLSEYSQTEYIYIEEMSNQYANGYSYDNTYADGSCGSYSDSGTVYESDGYEFARDNSFSYLSDGNGGYRIGYPYDGEYNYPIDDDSSEDVGEQTATSYDGQGVDEATFYDESGTPYVYDTYDVSTGDATFAAGAPQPAHGDWLRNSYGHIASTGRTPRMTTVEIPNGWRSTNAYWINNSVPELKGATSLQIQVGWIYSGRKRWHSGLQRFVADSAFANSENEGGVTSADGAILPNNVECVLPTVSAAGPKTFYEAAENPSGGLANPYTFTSHSNYWAYSNGDGTARFQQK